MNDIIYVHKKMLPDCGIIDTYQTTIWLLSKEEKFNPVLKILLKDFLMLQDKYLNKWMIKVSQIVEKFQKLGWTLWMRGTSEDLDKNIRYSQSPKI